MIDSHQFLSRDLHTILLKRQSIHQWRDLQSQRKELRNYSAISRPTKRLALMDWPLCTWNQWFKKLHDILCDSQHQSRSAGILKPNLSLPSQTSLTPLDKLIKCYGVNSQTHRWISSFLYNCIIGKKYDQEPHKEVFLDRCCFFSSKMSCLPIPNTPVYNSFLMIVCFTTD